MTLLVAPCQVSKFFISFDENNPGKITVEVEKHTHFLGERARIPERPIPPHMIQFEINLKEELVEGKPHTVSLSQAYRSKDKYCFTNIGSRKSELVLVQIGKEDKFAQTGLNYHGKFRINDLLDNFTSFKQSEQGPNVKKVNTYEIYTKSKKFEIDYAFEAPRWKKE